MNSIKTKEYYQKKYLSRHPSGNLLSLETLLFNKLISCELFNRPIILKSRLDYSIWVEVNQECREYHFFTMKRSISISKLNSNTFQDRIKLRKEYESLYNKEFEYSLENIRISSPHRIFVSTICNHYNLSDIKLIIMESFHLIATSKSHRDRWKRINHLLYKSNLPIDSYYRLGNYPRCEDIFTDSRLQKLQSIGTKFINNTEKTIFTQNVLYSYKNNNRMNVLQFDKSRELYNSKDYFRKLSVKQLLFTDHSFYKLNQPYDYCYVNVILESRNEKYIDIDDFQYEYTHEKSQEYLKPIVEKLFISNRNISLLTSSEDEEEDEDNEFIIENSGDDDTDDNTDRSNEKLLKKRKYIDLLSNFFEKEINKDHRDNDIPWIARKRANIQKNKDTIVIDDDDDDDDDEIKN